MRIFLNRVESKMKHKKLPNYNGNFCQKWGKNCYYYYCLLTRILLQNWLEYYYKNCYYYYWLEILGFIPRHTLTISTILYKTILYEEKSEKLIERSIQTHQTGRKIYC